MQTQKIVKCKVVGLTNIKQKCIETEYDILQKAGEVTLI